MMTKWRWNSPPITKSYWIAANSDKGVVMKVRARVKIRPELFTGTMADVSFLLVIFFVITAVFTASKGLDLSLKPQETGPLVVEPAESVEVVVLRGGSLRVDGSRMPVEALLGYVSRQLVANPAKPVIVRAEAEASYGALVRVLDELRMAPEKAGFEVENLVIPTFREISIYWPRLGAESS